MLVQAHVLVRTVANHPKERTAGSIATAEGKIDLGGTRRGEMPVCTRFGAAQRGQFAAPRSRLEARSCWLRSVLSAPPRAAVRPDAIHLKISYVPGKALA